MQIESGDEKMRLSYKAKSQEIEADRQNEGEGVTRLRPKALQRVQLHRYRVALIGIVAKISDTDKVALAMQ